MNRLHEILDGLSDEECLLALLILRRRLRPANVPKEMAVHHVDGNPYNNNPANLRLVDPRENRR